MRNKREMKLREKEKKERNKEKREAIVAATGSKGSVTVGASSDAAPEPGRSDRRTRRTASSAAPRRSGSGTLEEQQRQQAMRRRCGTRSRQSDRRAGPRARLPSPTGTVLRRITSSRSVASTALGGAVRRVWTRCWAGRASRRRRRRRLHNNSRGSRL